MLSYSLRNDMLISNLSRRTAISRISGKAPLDADLSHVHRYQGLGAAKASGAATSEAVGMSAQPFRSSRLWGKGHVSSLPPVDREEGGA